MEEKKLVPKLRFPGFTEPWEQRKLADVANIVMGQSPSSQNYTDNPNDDILVQGNADLIDGQVVPRLWTKEITKSIDEGNIVMTVRAPVGDVAKTAYKVVLGRGVTGIKGDEYIYQFLLKLKYNHYWRSLSSGSTFESINSNDIKNLIIDIPCDEERTKIGNLLSTTDTLITLHQRKLEHLKLKKKSLLQKLFPKEGEVYPELRFPGFTDPWEQRKLDEVFQIIDGDRGKNYPGTGDFLSNGDVLFLDTGNVRKDGFNFDNKRYIDFNRDKLLRNGRLILGDYVLTSRGTLGNLAYYSQSIYNRYPHIRINSAMLILRMMNTIKVNNLYLYITLRSNVINEFMKHNFVGSAQPHITKKEFSSVLLPIPRQLEEQKIIGDFFDKLEKIITLHQRKLEHLQLLKKALLQQLFV